MSRGPFARFDLHLVRETAVSTGISPWKRSGQVVRRIRSDKSKSNWTPRVRPQWRMSEENGGKPTRSPAATTKFWFLIHEKTRRGRKTFFYGARRVSSISGRPSFTRTTLVLSRLLVITPERVQLIGVKRTRVHGEQIKRRVLRFYVVYVRVRVTNTANPFENRLWITITVDRHFCWGGGNCCRRPVCVYRTARTILGRDAFNRRTSDMHPTPWGDVSGRCPSCKRNGRFAIRHGLGPKTTGSEYVPISLDLT